MKKITILWMPALLLSWCSATTPAQAQEETPKKKITIVLKEEGGKESVYEYNSEEELAADKRLDGKMLQLLDKGIQIESFGFDGDSIAMEVGREMVLGGLAAEPGEQPIIREFSEEIRQKLGPGWDNKLQFDVLKMGAASLESLPEAAQASLREHGITLKEGEKLMIVQRLDKMPEPPLPPAPAEPSAPAEQKIPAEPATPPAPPAVVGQPPVSEEAPEWLEALQIYPNPAEDAVRVRFRSLNGGPAVLKLIDMQGGVVYEENIPDAGLTIERTIKAPAGKKEVFILQLEQEASKLNRRVLLH